MRSTRVLSERDHFVESWIEVPSAMAVSFSARLGRNFRVRLTANATLEPPHSPYSFGQRILLRVEQDTTGGWTLTPNAAGISTVGSLPASGIATAANSISYVELHYDPLAKLWELRGLPDLSTLYLTPAAASLAYQPLDSDLTAIAALSTTAFGRGLLTEVSAATARATLGVGVPPLVYANSTIPAGNTVADTASETAFSSTVAFPANTLAAGDVLRVKLFGVYGTALIAPTLRGKMKLGGTTLLDTGALTTVAGVANAGWSAEAYLIVTAIGSGGTFEAQGFAQFATAATTGLSVNIANTAAISKGTDADLALTVTVQFSANGASNTITLRQMAVEKLRAA